MKAWIIRIAPIITALVSFAGTVAISTSCRWFFHQPEVPKEFKING